MQSIKQTRPGGVARTQQRSAVRPQRMSVRAAAQVETVEAPAAAAAEAEPKADGAEIYIGFAKGDYAPRAGRKGRVIRDDPAKYPAKEDLGFLPGATGGWAGGEAGLWKLREEVLAQKAAKKEAAAAAGAPAVPPPEGGKAPIYIGHAKGDYESRKVGAPGRFILDDPAKYPAKEDLGFFAGATGGFAAGEAGLKQFLRDGDVNLRKAGQPGGNRDASPIPIAGLLVLAGAGGGLLIQTALDQLSSVIKP